MTDTGITVAGRTFRPVTPRRMEHFQYVSYKLLAADAMDGGAIAEICSKVADAGYGPEMFAGLHVECDADGPIAWTPKRAKKLADEIRRMSSPADCTAVTTAVMSGLYRFFGPAAVSSSDSPTSSDEPAATTSPTTVEHAPPVPSGSPS